MWTESSSESGKETHLKLEISISSYRISIIYFLPKEKHEVGTKDKPKEEMELENHKKIIL